MKYAINFWRGDENVGGAWWLSAAERDAKIAEAGTHSPFVDRITAHAMGGRGVTTLVRGGASFVEVAAQPKDADFARVGARS
jgi:hypothetical protein